MIPESAGATPFGIFMLAKSFDEAAAQVMATPALRFSHGPVRLLLYHACELYLKAYLRRHEWDVSRLRSLNHDLSHMLDEAVSAGLKVAPQTVAQIRNAAAKNDYVRVRYMVTEDRKSEISPQSLARLTMDIRESVRPACDPHGSSGTGSSE
jgi:HEPN domain-containing protein